MAQYYSVSLKKKTRDILELLATRENRSLSSMIDVIVDDYYKMYCPECEQRLQTKTCQCKLPEKL